MEGWKFKLGTNQVWGWTLKTIYKNNASIYLVGGAHFWLFCFVFCLPGSSSCSSPARLPLPPPFLLLLSSKEDRLGENSFCNRLHKTTGSEVSSEFETAPAENTGEAVLEAACDGANEAPLEVTKTRYM